MVVDEIRSALSNEQVLEGDDLKEKYDHIWNMATPLKAKAYVLPRSPLEVSTIMKICYQYDQPIVVFGGLTNLVGSTETAGNEIVISMEKLNRIEELDSFSRTITVEAGVILEHIQDAAAKVDLLFPLNYGAKGSAQIGGAISTNAGGLRVLKFGMTRNLVLGLEVVKSNGEIVSSMKKIIKDNSGYDIKQLFIGSEGTLGIITRAILKLTESPITRNSAFIGLTDFDQVGPLLKFMDAGLAGTLSAFELIWPETYKEMTSEKSQVRPPIPHGFSYYVLIESLGSVQEKDHTTLQDLLELAFQNGLIKDAVIAHSQSDLEWFWKIREDVHVFVSLCKVDQHFDVSLPLPHIGNYARSVINDIKAIPEVEHVFTFGHVADGNIHFVVGKTTDDINITQQINDIVYNPLKQLGGSISAEHGIGLHKKSYLPLCRSDEEIALMRLLKKSLDPKGLLNPGKVF